jgi:hypothetical protein
MAAGARSTGAAGSFDGGGRARRPRRGAAAVALALATALLGVGAAAAVVVAEPDVAPVAQSTTFAPAFAVSGLVGAPQSFTRDDLGGLPQVTLPVVFGSGAGIESGVITGPRLLDVLDAAGGPKFPPERNAKLRTYVLATGADGYQAVLAWGEVDPDDADPPAAAVRHVLRPLNHPSPTESDIRSVYSGR